MPRETFDGVDWYNAVEAVYWSLVGVGVCFAMRDGEKRPSAGVRYGLAGWLVAFGASDVVENFTGSWWRPWPLGCSSSSRGRRSRCSR